MLGATELTAVLGATPAGTDRAPMKGKFDSYLRACTNIGLHLLYIEPGSKAPIDYRTEHQIEADRKRLESMDRKGDAAGWNLAINDSSTLIKYGNQGRERQSKHALQQLDNWARKEKIGPFHPDYISATVATKTAFTEFNTAGKKEKKNLSERLTPFSIEIAHSEGEYQAVSEAFNDALDLLVKGANPSNKTAAYLDVEWNSRVADIVTAASTLLNLGEEKGVDKDIVSDALDAVSSFKVTMSPLAIDFDKAIAKEKSAAVQNGPLSPEYLSEKESIEQKAETAPLSLAMEPGASRVVVIDADTEEEVQAFQKYWYEQTGDPRALIASPTVRTPGAFGRNHGEWKHKNGGHYYMRLPEGYDLPENTPGKIPVKVDLDEDTSSEFTIMLHSGYVLIPPSSRVEGRYRLISDDLPWLDWVQDLIEERAAEATEHKEKREKKKTKTPNAQPSAPQRSSDPLFNYFTYDQDVDIDSHILKWGEKTSWSELLEPHGWNYAGFTDKCGCDIWTAPGDHASPKSATAHDSLCSEGTTDAGGRLHIWTDNPGPEFDNDIAHNRRSFSKLQADTLLNFEGNTAKAMKSHDIPIRGNQSNDDYIDNVIEFNARLFGDLGSEFEEDEYQPTTLRPFREVRNVKPPTYLVDQTLEEHGLIAINGPSGVGKSYVVLDLLCSIATETTWLGRATKQVRVGYAAGEGFSGAVTRIRAWEAARLDAVGKDFSGTLDDNLFVADQAFDLNQMSKDPSEMRRIIEMIRATNVELLVLDTWARSIPGVDENSAEEIGEIIKKLDIVRKITNCAICVVHHTAKGNPDEGRGSTALKGATDSELLVSNYDTPDVSQYPGKPIAVRVTKQKNAAEWDEPSVCCISKLDFEDETWKDVEVPPGFTIADSPPGWAVITDTIGMFSGAGLGQNNYGARETKTGLSYKDVMPSEICTTIWDMLRERNSVSATRAEIISFIGDRLYHTLQATPSQKQEILAALNTCVQMHIVQKIGQSFTVNKATPNRDVALRKITDSFKEDADA